MAREELLDQLLAGRDPNEVFAKDGLLDDLKKALSERILNAELDEHLDGERVEGGANRRNDHSKKSVLTGTSKMTLSNPRDRAGTFDPKGAAHWLKIKNPPCRSGNQRRKLWLRCMSSPLAVCHEYRRSIRRDATVREMKEGPSRSAIRC